MKIRKVIMVALATTMLVAKASTVHASSWRVNNDATKKAHFVDINAAMASEEVHDGDTLYLDPGISEATNSDVTQTISKSVTIIGPGWNNHSAYGSFTFKGNPNPYTRRGYDIYVTAANCKLEGIIFDDVCTLHIQSDYVTIERCKILYMLNVSEYSRPARHVTVRNCWINSSGCISGYDQNNSEYCTIENNVIITTSMSCIQKFKNATIRSNYLYYTPVGSYSSKNCTELTNCTITDNIIIRNGADYHSDLFGNLTNCTVNNNILSCAEGTYPEYPDNKCIDSFDLSTIFTMEGEDGDYYRLTADSPAKGYATDGGDCGIFGGAYPYVAGGLPYGHPYYTRAVVGSTAHDGKLNVSLKVKMQDE